MITERKVDNYMREITVTYKLSEEQKKSLNTQPRNLRSLLTAEVKKAAPKMKTL